MKIASLGLVMALAAAPAVANAQVTVSGGISFNFGSLPGEAVPSTDVFYDQLAPYGVWVDDPTVGQVFIPDESGYVPYTNGHWEDTDVGFVWVSSEPFAWATSHYGRWFYDSDYGRWAWLPDTTWGPNWVDWYEADGSFGWAPLAPEVIIQTGYQPPVDCYHFVPSAHIFDTNVRAYYVPRDRVETIRTRARPVAHRESVHDHQVITGPAPEALQRARVTVHRKPVANNTKLLGRFDANQARTIEQRAKERRPQIEQQNARRLDQHADLKRAVETKAQKSPARPETKRPETKRTETTRPETTRPEQRTQPERTTKPEPRPETTRPEQPERTTPRPDMNRTQPKAEPQRTESTRPEPQTTRPEPQTTRPEPQSTRPEPKAEPQREPMRTEPKAEPQRTEPQREPMRTEPKTEPMRTEPTRPEPQATRPEPQRPEPKAMQPKAEHAPARGNDNRGNDNKHRDH
jgi:hypothetical protein